MSPSAIILNLQLLHLSFPHHSISWKSFINPTGWKTWTIENCRRRPLRPMYELITGDGGAQQRRDNRFYKKHVAVQLRKMVMAFACFASWSQHREVQRHPDPWGVPATAFFSNAWVMEFLQSCQSAPVKSNLYILIGWIYAMALNICV